MNELGDKRNNTIVLNNRIDRNIPYCSLHMTWLECSLLFTSPNCKFANSIYTRARTLAPTISKYTILLVLSGDNPTLHSTRHLKTQPRLRILAAQLGQPILHGPVVQSPPNFFSCPPFNSPLALIFVRIICQPSVHRHGWFIYLSPSFPSYSLSNHPTI